MCIKRGTVFLAFFVVIFVFFPKVSSAASTLVIDEFQVSSSDSTYDEYLKVANYASSSFDLSGFQLIKKTSSGSTTNILVTFAEPLPAKSSFIVAYKDSAFAESAKYIYSNASLAYNCSVYIYDPKTKSIIDLIAFGSYYSNYNEGTALQNPEDDDVYLRQDGKDTDDNAKDFQLKQIIIPYDSLASQLLITEIYLNPTEGGEWVELFNPASAAVNLDNLKLCDVFGRVHCYNFKEGSFIQPREYLVLPQTTTRITLNNDGDAISLVAPDGAVLAENPESGEAAKGETFALFGNEWKWTATPTKGAQNLFVDTIEKEEETAPKKKTARQKVKVALASTEIEDAEAPETVAIGGEPVKAVKAAEKANFSEKVFQITQKQLGYGLIALAILCLLGYTMYENKGKINEIYHKFTGRNG